jgi:hypothetical protein
MQTCSSPVLDEYGTWNDPDVAGIGAGDSFRTAFVRRNMNRFYRVPIMRQALLMRRTKENTNLVLYQYMQSFSRKFICVDTTLAAGQG